MHLCSGYYTMEDDNMHISGKEYSRQDLLRKSGNLASLYGARRMTLMEGVSSGLRVIEVWTAGGLRLLLSEDRCLDILEGSFRGNNLGILTKNGVVSNTYANPSTDDFANYWSGGLLSTCGLRNTGGGAEYEGEYFATHGRIGTTPACNVGVHIDDAGVITVTGTVCETALFGHSLELRRTLEIPADGAKIVLRDEIRNNTPQDEPLFLLYHLNFGFPFLDEGLQIDFPKSEIRGRTPHAAAAIDSHKIITAPIDGEPEQVFFHLPEQKDARVDLTNRTIGVRASLLYDAERLPVLTQWKSMGSGDYALGIEPGTSFLRGREVELNDGYSACVKAFDALSFEIELRFAEC